MKVYVDRNMERVLDRGINFFRSTNIFSANKSEENLRNELLKYTKSSEVFISTKLFNKEYPGSVNKKGL